MDTDKKHPEEASDFDELHHQGEIPAFVKEYGVRIVVGVVVFLLAISAFQMIRYNIGESQREKKERLASLVVKQKQMAIEAVNRDPENPSADAPASKPYTAEGFKASLAQLAKEASGSSVGKMALLQQAEAIRSELVFMNRFFSPEEKQAISREAGAIYESLLKKYPNDPAVTGPALIAQGLLAEELGQWDQAAEFYNRVIGLEDKMLAGTVFPQEARGRLAGMEKNKETVQFAEPPAPVIAPEPAVVAPEPAGVAPPVAPEGVAPVEPAPAPAPAPAPTPAPAPAPDPAPAPAPDPAPAAAPEVK